MLTVDSIRQRLTAFSLYSPEQVVYCKEGDGNIYLNWQTGSMSPRNRGTYFDTQVTNGMFYLLHIEINQEYRGQGLGFQLYNIIEEIAKDSGSHTIEMTPSGWTTTRESRMAYVCRKLHYRPQGIVAVKKLRD